MSLTTGWILLLAAGALEVAWAVGLKWTGGFSRPGPALVVILAMIASFALLALSTRAIPVAVAYAAWVGIGIVGTWAVTTLLLREPVTPLQLVCVTLVLGGVIGLKLTSPSPGHAPMTASARASAPSASPGSATLPFDPPPTPRAQTTDPQR
jgi:quaternary ammonium compound-resistance protein SugE